MSPPLVATGVEMVTSTPAPVFTVRRRPAVLVAPEAETPRELKLLSDIDDHESIRRQTPTVILYRMSNKDDDPAPVIRDAVSRALVPYYPLAGRLRELEGGKLAVDCTGEGVLFIEADADVSIEQFGHTILPPFPCLAELLFDAEGSSGIVDTPLMLFQVTRMACGGFCLAVRLNHTMADAHGLTQFLGAVAEMARGALAPTVEPVWERELLAARNPPRPFPTHTNDDNETAAVDVQRLLRAMPLDDMASCFFFFGPRQVAAVRAQLGPRLRERASKLDIVLGSVWKCRAAALALDAGEVMRLVSVANARGRPSSGGVIPMAYYGNAIGFPVATSTAGELRANPVGHAVELVNGAKDQVDMEYMQSLADLFVQRGRRGSMVPLQLGTYVVSDTTKARFGELDMGWDSPVYAGAALAMAGPCPWFASFLLPFTNAEGERGVVVPTSLPGPAMAKFVEELDKLLGQPQLAGGGAEQPNLIPHLDVKV